MLFYALLCLLRYYNAVVVVFASSLYLFIFAKIIVAILNLCINIF